METLENKLMKLAEKLHAPYPTILRIAEMAKLSGEESTSAIMRHTEKVAVQQMKLQEKYGAISS